MGDKFPCSSFVDAPPGPRTNHGLEVRFGRKRDKSVSFAFGRVSGFVKQVWRVTHWTRGRDPTSASASVSEGGERSDPAKRAMPPTVCYCGGMQSWWRRVRYKVFSGGGRKRTMYAVMSSHRAPGHPPGALHTSLCLSSGRFFQCRTRSRALTNSVSNGCWLVSRSAEVVDGYGYGAMQWRKWETYN